MQVDISREFLRWKALDRWENEGGRALADRIELSSNSSTDNAQEPSMTGAHATVERHLYSNGKIGRQSYEH